MTQPTRAEYDQVMIPCYKPADLVMTHGKSAASMIRRTAAILISAAASPSTASATRQRLCARP